MQRHEAGVCRAAGQSATRTPVLQLVQIDPSIGRHPRLRHVHRPGSLRQLKHFFALWSIGGTTECSVCASGTCITPAMWIHTVLGAMTTVWDWINQVNRANSAGHSDWRLLNEQACNSCWTRGLHGDSSAYAENARQSRGSSSSSTRLIIPRSAVRLRAPHSDRQAVPPQLGSARRVAEEHPRLSASGSVQQLDRLGRGRPPGCCSSASLDWHGPCSPRWTLGSRGRGEEMGAQDYYFSSKSMPTLGRMWILKMLQDASGSGGGLNMLGSVVQE